MAGGRLAPAVIRAVDRDPDCAVVTRFHRCANFRFTESVWLAFLLGFLDDSQRATSSWIVPSPHAPHLFLDWLEAHLRQRHPRAEMSRQPLQAELSLPFQYSDGGGNLYLSGAAWTCPVSCREPQVCPVIRARRSWEMSDIIRARAARSTPRMTPIVWKSEYICPGVAAVPAGKLLLGAQTILSVSDGRGRAAVATVSACHGVVGVLDYDLAVEDQRCA